MMDAVKAFVLIETEKSKAAHINDLLRHFQEVASTDLVTSPYDAIVVINATTEEQLHEFMNDKLRSIVGITRTVLCEAAPV
jgi:DNA-binding Lrp family transcriptional regulator